MRLDQRGMTIVEVLVAAAIIGIGLVALMVTVPISTYGLQQGKQQSTATFLAEQRMEQIRNATWQLITPGPELDCLGVGPNAPPTSNNCTRTNPTPCNSGAACTTFADEPNVTGYTGYGRTVRIVDCGAIGCAGITDAGMRLATVSVSYTPLTGSGVSTTAQNVTVSMLIAKRQ